MRRLKRGAVLVLIAAAVAGCARLLPADTHRAEACVVASDFPCAEREYRTFLRAHPRDARRAAMLGMVLTRLGRHAEALPYYDQAERAGLRTFDIYANHAVSLDAAGRVEQAMAYNRLALELVPQLVDARGHLAEQLTRQGRRSEAIGLLQTYEDQRLARGEGPYFSDEIAKLRRGAALGVVFGEERGEEARPGG